MHAVDRCVRDCTYRRGLGVACSDLRAIPEPHVAEQQQCSPAFFVSMINIIHKKHENTIKIQILEMAHRPQNKVCYYCVLQAQAYLS